MQSSVAFRSTVSLAALISLSACGGGGVNSASSTAPVADPVATGTSAPVTGTGTTPAPTSTGTTGTGTTGTGTGATGTGATGTTGVTATPTTGTTTTTTTPTTTTTTTPPTTTTTTTGTGTTTTTTTGTTTTTTTTGSTTTISTGYVPAKQQPQRSANDDGEYRQRYVDNEYIHALYAYDAGWTGKGVTVGVIDDGIDTANPEFADRISPLSRDFGHTVTGSGGDQSLSARNVLGDSFSGHGTATAGLIAADRDGSSVEGIAYEAQVAMLRVTDVNYGTAVEDFPSVNITAALNYAAQKGIKIVSQSINVTSSFMDARQITAIANYGATGGLVINSAGNAGTAAPAEASMLSSAALRAYLFVGAVDVGDSGVTIASYSNRAGSVADRYVVAPGTNVVLVNGKAGGTMTAQGTSFSAPIVAGLAALILEKWPQLSGQQAGAIILNTAQDLGAPGVDAIYGHGLVDVQAALSPVSPSLTNGGGASASVASSVVVASGAMSGNHVSAALTNVTVLDAYGRNFQANLSGAVLTPDTRQSVRGLVGQNASGQVATVGTQQVHGVVGYSFYGDRARPGTPQTGFNFGKIEGRIGAVGFAVGYRANTGVNAPILGLGPVSDGFAAYAPQADRTVGLDLPAFAGMRLAVTSAVGAANGASASAIGVGLRGPHGGVRVGVVNETGAVLGTISTGGLALGRGARTVMIEGDRTLPLTDRWSLKGYASLGYTRARVAAASLFTSVSALTTTRFGVTMEGQVAGGLLSFGIAQPLNVEGGHANLHLADGYDLASQSLTYGDRSVGLAGARRLQLSGGFEKVWTRSALRFGLTRDVTQARSTGALVSYTIAF